MNSKKIATPRMTVTVTCQPENGRRSMRAAIDCSLMVEVASLLMNQNPPARSLLEAMRDRRIPSRHAATAPGGRDNRTAPAASQGKEMARLARGAPRPT